MEIIAHRGYWKEKTQQNTLSALIEALGRGYGVETDVRDLNRELVISHDMPSRGALRLVDFLECLTSDQRKQCLCLNIKSDGLQSELAALLQKFAIERFYVFDMSVPDTLHYQRAGTRYFTRQSDVEPLPSLYESCAGVWIDEFHRPWLTKEIAIGHLLAGKQICLVSPELHRRAYVESWNLWRSWFDSSNLTETHRRALSLCTDFPDEAEEFFNGH